MKRAILISTLVAAAGLALAALWQAPRPVAFAKHLPPGALLVLEARDFSALVADWNASDRKRLWLASDNFSVFSRSRLFQRLADMQGQYAAAAGFAPDYSLVELCAGKESVLALYDIPKLEFLYITRTSGSGVLQKILAQASGKYEPREAAGEPYFLRIDKSTGRAAAFAASGDLLLVATREELLASALASLKGQSRPAVADEPWYAKPVQAAGAPGELRLVMNLPELVKTPHFRSYWIQRNAAEIRLYASAIADLDRSPDRIAERRVLVRQEPATLPAGAANAGGMLSLVPEDAAFYRATGAPSSEELLARLTHKLIAPGPGSGEPLRQAPAAADPDALAGTAADLETRIDEPPLKTETRVDTRSLAALLASNRVLAALEIGSTQPLPGGVFLEPRQAVALMGTSTWDANAARAAFPAEVTVQTRGALLVIGRDPRQVHALLERSKNGVANSVTYAAGYRYTPEFNRFMNLFQLLEQSGRSASYQSQAGGSEAPSFFSGNLGSLGRGLLRMQSASLLVHDLGDRLEEQVEYRVAP